jgi:hypothetical protein
MAGSGTGAHLAEGALRRGDHEPAAEEEAAIAKGRGGAARGRLASTSSAPSTADDPLHAPHV